MQAGGCSSSETRRAASDREATFPYLVLSSSHFIAEHRTAASPSVLGGSSASRRTTPSACDSTACKLTLPLQNP